MQRNRSWLLIVVAVLVIGLVSGGAALAGPPKQGPVGSQSTVVPVGGGNGPAAGSNTANGTAAGIEDSPYGLFPYQGKLVQNGNPYSGTIDITFRLYTVAITGTAWWEETQNVQVTDGLFNVMLGAVTPLNNAAVYFSAQQWLGIQPAGAANELAPRSLLGAAPYAMGLLPGTTVVDHNPGSAPYGRTFYIWSANHPAIYGGSNVAEGVFGVSYYTGTGAIGVIGWHNANTGTDPGVLGASNSTNSEATGVVGRIVSTTPGGYSAAVRGINQGTGGNGIGVWGSQNGWGWGVYGTAESGLGVYGNVAMTGTGVYGSSGTGTGVYGWTGSDDLDNYASIWGDKGGNGVAVRGNKSGSTGVGVKGSNVGATGSGVAGDSTNYLGVWGETGDAGNNFGLYTPDNLWSLNYNLAGAIMHLAQNGGSAALEAGDVVVFSGISAPLANGVPVVQVARANAANSTAVAGVVYSGFNVAVADGSLDAAGTGLGSDFQVTIPGPVAPGEYLLIVVQGPAQVKVTGATAPGDLLGSAGLAGYAARAAEIEVGGVRTAVPGAVLGKALEAVESGEKTIYVFVTLQ